MTKIYKINRNLADNNLVISGLGGDKNNEICLNGETIQPVNNVVNINALTSIQIGDAIYGTTAAGSTNLGTLAHYVNMNSETYTANSEGTIDIGNVTQKVTVDGGTYTVDAKGVTALPNLTKSIYDGSTTYTTDSTGKVDISKLISTINTNITTAQTTANTAKTNAATAQSAADKAQTTANNAQTAADKAQSTADTAKTNAATAQTTANTANSTANTAKTTADTALALVNSVKPVTNNLYTGQRNWVSKSSSSYTLFWTGSSSTTSTLIPLVSTAYNMIFTDAYKYAWISYYVDNWEEDYAPAFNGWNLGHQNTSTSGYHWYGFNDVGSGCTLDLGYIQLNSTTRRYWVKATSNGYTLDRLALYSNGTKTPANGTPKIYNVMLSFGDSLAEYEPAVEDLDTSISNLSTTVTNNYNTLNNKITTINNTGTKITTSNYSATASYGMKIADIFANHPNRCYHLTIVGRASGGNQWATAATWDYNITTVVQSSSWSMPVAGGVQLIPCKPSGSQSNYNYDSGLYDLNIWFKWTKDDHYDVYWASTNKASYFDYQFIWTAADFSEITLYDSSNQTLLTSAVSEVVNSTYPWKGTWHAALDRTVLSKNYGSITGTSISNSGTLYVGGTTRLGTSTSTYKLNVGGDIYSTATIRGTTLQLSGLGYSSSDKRLKNIHGAYDISLNEISKIPVVSYDMKDDNEHQKTIGTIAQDIQNIVPEIVTEDDKGYLALDYSRLGLIGVKGVQLLITEIQELKEEIKRLKEVNNELH